MQADITMPPWLSPALLRSPFACAALPVCLVVAVLASGCRQEKTAGSHSPPAQVASTAPSPASGAAPLPAAADDGLSAAPDAWASQLQGRHVLWEDFEGGRVCRITLTDERTIGGYAVTSDEPCIRRLAIPEDLFAWFIDAEGWLVLIDVTRRPLLRMKPSPSDGDFYAQRSDQQLENLVLSVDDH